MAVFYGGRYQSVADVRGPSGFYNIILDGENVPVYINQEYSGGGWVLVLANRINTGGMNNLTYSDAINTPNYRSGGVAINPYSKLSGLNNYNVWIGLKYWSRLAGRVTAGNITVVQFVSPTSGISLAGSHTKRYRWRFTNFNGTYAMTGVAAVSDETGSGAPGFYASHAAAGANLTTFDRDQDTNGGNCSTSYNNNPWWYTSCWSGNYFAGGSGYQDAPYWTGSSSDYHNYGAVYIK